MSYEPPYTYCISHGPFTALRFLLNDIPFYRIVDTRKETGVTETCVADHLLVPGENTFGFEIHESDEKYYATFDLQKNHDRQNNLFELVWPLIYKYIPAVTSQPFSYTLSFRMPDDFTFRSAFLSATPQSFGPEGNRALHEAVLRYYDALLRVVVGSPLYTDEHLEKVFRKRFSKGLEVRPIRLEDLHFESRAGGRVAYVTCKDGDRPILCVTPDGMGMDHDLWLTHYEGDWQIFR
jgi:hypothetical protein